MVLITNKNSSTFGTVYYLNQDNPGYHGYIYIYITRTVITIPTHTLYCMQEVPACNGLVVKDSSYQLSCRCQGKMIFYISLVNG